MYQGERVITERRIIKRTKCLCPICLEVIGAEVFEEDNKIWLGKYCNKDGFFKTSHLLSNPLIYHTLNDLHRDKSGSPEGLLIYLTRKCNQYCPYCFSNANNTNDSSTEDPALEMIIERVKSFYGDVIYLFGGEPTLREDLLEVIKKIKEERFRVILFTNGKKLADLDYVSGLKKAGVDAIILQFDSLNDQDNIKIRGESLLELKLKAVSNLKACGIYLMLYVNVVEGINDDKVKVLFDFALQVNNVRILFFNPLWNIGRQASKTTLDAAGMLDKVCREIGVKEEYFSDCIKFSTSIFEISRKLRFRKGIKEPPCSVSCYFIRYGNSYLTLDYILNLKKVNLYLQRIEQAINISKSRIFNIVNLIPKKDLYLFLAAVIINQRALRIILKNFLHNLRYPQHCKNIYYSFFNILSVMVGQFPDKDSLDLSLTKTCNMHTSLEGGGSLPTCLYEIYREGNKIE
ncbi:MAG: radical SAM protein [Candidatus Omnitrophota bacterium]